MAPPHRWIHNQDWFGAAPCKQVAIEDKSG